MEKKVTSHITKGLIISLILIVLSLISYFTDSQQASWSQWSQNIILFGGIIWACISFGNQMNNQVTFGNVFAHGFKVSAVITCISILFTIIFLLAFPEVKEKSLELARTEMEKAGNMGDEQIEQAIGMASRLFYVFAIGGIVFLYLIIGVIASLIGAAVTKKQPKTPFENQL